ncbi:ribosome recycling factor [Candidatus Woesebacteria bacterium RIFCSPHIGHO2_01_FULL_41_10]|uniref:Ribosome recycling factor n=1 Tax=Candidatus Woesebacteria bacterium RIFCSPHIGHO2_01_FULL_41_10 TaxID=1802500 RepID=A0A1F7YRN9_9BACT|nr:MAG: ribosome recycling factor [Candidatus Woesebacteria bacterium RIFCSPHIGHO2_01_FULL_41_10]
MDLAELRKKMQEVISMVTTDIGSVRSGRVTPALVENIEVPAYGGTQNMRLLELAGITASDPQTLVIEPWDKSIIGDIRKGILAANVGLNPSIDGDILRISVPPMTGEDRQKFVKLLHTKIENGRVMVRQIRGDAMRDLKKGFEEKTVTEDDKFKLEKEIQDATDEFIEIIDTLGKNKETELLTV